MHTKGPIGIFDSGYGGLTILKAIARQLPDYDYLYLGDNARAPYGNRSYETVYQYTLEAVEWFFRNDCSLVILACNTASAKALRSIQQQNLPAYNDKRVLGVIRPTAEIVGNFSHTGHIGVLGTTGTVKSGSYNIEIHKFFPEATVYQQACPMWVPIIENGEQDSTGADYFVKEYIDNLLQQSPDIDTILLGCTHYPLLMSKIRSYLSDNIRIVDQGDIIAKSLEDYLQRHPEMEILCSKNGTKTFFTTDNTDIFNQRGEVFYGNKIVSAKATI